MNNTNKVVVVGCGYWGKNLIRNFHELNALAGICDNDYELVKKFAVEYDVATYTLNQIASNPGVTGVVLASPAETHAYIAKGMFLANKHVYIEKPMALDLSDAKELCSLAEKQKKTLMVGHLLQYHPVFLKMKEMIDSRELGKLQYIYSNRLNLGKIRREENILWSFAPHDISMILSLVGEEPNEVTAFGSSILQPGIADITLTHLSFPGGVKAHIYVSWLNPSKEQKLVVIGEKGMLVFNDSFGWDSKLQWFPGHVSYGDEKIQLNKQDPILIQVEEQEPLRNECQHFLDCIANNTKPRTDGEEGLRVLRVLQRAEAALVKYIEVPANVE